MFGDGYLLSFVFVAIAIWFCKTWYKRRRYICYDSLFDILTAVALSVYLLSNFPKFTNVFSLGCRLDQQVYHFWGNVFQFDINNPMQGLSKWKRQFGDIFTIKLLGQDIVVVSIITIQ